MNQVFSAVKALIIKDDRYLMLEHTIKDKKIWELPGGRIKFGETPYEALDRELAEELNARITINKYLGVYWFFRIIDGDEVICSVFLCELLSSDFDLSKNPSGTESISQINWLTKKEILQKMVSHESFKELMRKIKN